MPAKYLIKNHDFITDDTPEISLRLRQSPRRYILKIRDLPEDEKPREKLLAHGADVLSTEELLAIVLSSGTKKEGVLEMAGRIIRDYGQKALVNHKDAKALSAELKIPIVKALQVVAAGELGRRFFKEKGRGETIRTAEDVYEYLSDMRSLSKEHLRGIYLNNHHMVVRDEVISIGTVDSNIVHPREVFRPALECGAVAVILAHNHPSGVLKPSKADVEITKQIIECGKIMGIDLLDHVIIGKNGFISIDVDYNF